MRRQEKEITDRATLEAVLRQARVCRLALCDAGSPYLVPVCFGYRENNLYFHSGLGGKKLEILDRNNRVCFEVDVNVELVTGPGPCDCSMNYLSVIGTGRAYLVEEAAEKIEALNEIMKHYSRPAGGYDPDMLEETTVIRIEIESMTGKKSGY